MRSKHGSISPKGWFVVSDDRQPVSPSSLAVYATCPRQFEYDKRWQVETPEASRRYLDRGLVYHGVIEDTCEQFRDKEATDEELRRFAFERLDQRWATETDRAQYASDAQYRYDRDLTSAALESFFDTDGLDHVRNSVVTEEWLTCEHNGVRLRGRADNIVRTDDGIRVVDYKGSLNGIVSGYSAAQISQHRAGEEYAAGILKSVFQAATYIEGAKQLDMYDPGMDVEFSFYALLKDKTRTPHTEGIRVTVSGGEREVTDIYEDNREDIWEIIANCYRGIIGEHYEPERWEEIREHACEDCDYQSMCGDYLSGEVRIDG